MTDTTVVCVTGVSGSGKSALARLLRRWDHPAVGLDCREDLCTWVDGNGIEVTRPGGATAGWLKQHRWVWRRPVLEKLICDARATEIPALWLTGWAANIVACHDLFNHLILLDIDTDTMRSRLSNPSRGNDFGTDPTSQEWLVTNFDRLRTELAGFADESIDATVELQTVAEEVLASGTMALLRRSRTQPADTPDTELGPADV